MQFPRTGQKLGSTLTHSLTNGSVAMSATCRRGPFGRLAPDGTAIARVRRCMAKRADGEVLAMKVKLETAPSRGPQGYVVDFAILLKDAGVRWFDDNCLRLGASLAYYAVFSIFPLLLLAVTGVGFFLGHDPETRAHLLALATSASSPGFKTVFDETLRNMQAHETARGVGAVIGVVTLFVSTSAAFSELET